EPPVGAARAGEAQRSEQPARRAAGSRQHELRLRRRRQRRHRGVEQAERRQRGGAERAAGQPWLGTVVPGGVAPPPVVPVVVGVWFPFPFPLPLPLFFGGGGTVGAGCGGAWYRRGSKPLLLFFCDFVPPFFR